jgi:DNA-binding GntR family transcriptional regulator
VLDLFQPKILARDQARERILDLLTSNPLPNVSLSERSVAAAIGLGRTPVREALRELAHEGIVETHPSGTTTLRRMTLDEVRELYEVRFALEGMACHIAAERGGSEKLKEIAAELEVIFAQENQVEQDLLLTMQRVGDEMHHEIFNITHNKMLIDFYEILYLKIRILLRVTRPFAPDRIKETIAEHLAIAKAVLTGQPDVAQDLMVAHLRKGLATRTSVLQSLANVRVK